MNCNNMLQSNLQPAQKAVFSHVSWRDSVTAAYNSCNSYRAFCVWALKLHLFRVQYFSVPHELLKHTDFWHTPFVQVVFRLSTFQLPRSNSFPPIPFFLFPSQHNCSIFTAWYCLTKMAGPECMSLVQYAIKESCQRAYNNTLLHSATECTRKAAARLVRCGASRKWNSELNAD